MSKENKTSDKQQNSNDFIANVSSSARYIIIDESISHSCFGYTIVDTASGKYDYGGHWKRTMCETFDRAEAEIICDALNKHCY